MTTGTRVNELAAARLDYRQWVRRAGIAAVAFILAAGVAAKATSFYGILLRGFDSQFYFSAARSFVVSGDWDVTDDLPLSPWQAPFETANGVPTREDQGILNVFPMGLSLIEAAFLAPATALRGIVGGDTAPAGYGLFETAVVAVGLILIAAGGLQTTYALVRPVAARHWAAPLVFAAWLGTPLFYYTGWFPFSAHAVTFTLMALMLVIADRHLTAAAPNRWLVLFGVLAALLFLVRPHETTLTLLLAGWRAPALLRRPWRTWLPGAMAGGAVCVLAIGLQAYVHRVNVGHLALIAHGRHAHPAISGFFDLTAPHFDVVLLSAARGVFWVTPVIGLSLLGFVVARRSAPAWAWIALANAAIQTCILAFWSDPFQGDSFGIRLWGEQAAVVAAGLAFLTQRATQNLTRAALGFALAVLVSWTALLTVTYIDGQLPPTTTYSGAIQGVATTLRLQP